MDYAKDLSCKNVLRQWVLLKRAPVMFKSGTQQIVALFVCKEGLYVGISCVQGKLYIKHGIKSLSLVAMLPIKLEMDSKGAVDLGNNWSIDSHILHDGTTIVLICMYRENGVLEVVWMPGSGNNTNMFIKHLRGQLFC